MSDVIKDLVRRADRLVADHGYSLFALSLGAVKDDKFFANLKRGIDTRTSRAEAAHRYLLQLEIKHGLVNPPLLNTHHADSVAARTDLSIGRKDDDLTGAV